MNRNEEEAPARVRDELGPMMRGSPDVEDIFGDKQRDQVPFDTIRIEGLNTNTLPIHDDIRMEGLRNWATTSNANILPLTEINRDWGKIHPDKQPEQFMTGWWKQVSINKTWLKQDQEEQQETRNRRRYGGVALVTNNRLASTICAQGHDRQNLGRWVWTTYRGRNNYRTTIICLYYPHDKVDTEGTVYMQQAIALDKKHPGEQREPHSEYIKDLRTLLEEKLAQGDNILVTGDFNQDVQKWSAPIVKLLNQLGLNELIEQRHNNCTMPPTFDGGSHPIDGIFGTSVFRIQEGGYKEFSTNILSNHRAYWVDIPIHQILGGGLEAVVRPKGRRLQTHIPRIKAKYNLVLNNEIEKRKLVSRLRLLYDSVSDTKTMTPTQLKTLNNLILEQRRCIQVAERNCTKLRKGDVPYSKEIHEAMGRVVCWGLIVQREAMKGKKNRPHSKLVKNRIKRWRFQENYQGLTLKQMKRNLKAADKEWRKLKPTALEKRDTFLSQLAVDKSMQDGLKPQSHLKQLHNLEVIRKLFRRIKNATRTNIGGAASYIEEIQPDGSRKRISAQVPMEKGIKKANEEKLQQVKNVDLRKEPLQSHFGEQGDLKKWEAIHKGELRLPDDYPAEQGLRLYMDEISKNHLPQIDIIPNDKQYNESWKKMKEKTSCAPPLHFGHFIAPDEGSPASLVNTMIGTIPMITGAIPEAWKECVNTMLVKKINDMRPEKLRLVTLLQPQYLHASKLANKQMMAHAEKYYALAAEQYGSRKHKSSRTHCLNKRLVYDLTRIQHAIMVLIANDLKSCYDRILMMIAYETMRHLGLSEQVSMCLAVTMMEMKHKIRTVYGDSEDYYGGDKWEGGIKPAGNGQGNGNGPGLWAGISSVCLDIMRREGYGKDMESAISKVAIMLTGFAFVDDTDLIQHGETADDALDTAQKGLKLWEELMRATGGALEPSKSDWVMVNHIPRNGKWQLQEKKEERVLQVRGPDDNIAPLKQLKPTEARETLGIWQAPDGNEKTQSTKLKEAVEKWCAGIQPHCLPSRDVEIGIKSTIGRKIHYCLVATCMSKAQCKEIIDPIVRKVMPKMRLARNTARVIVHAPTTLLGIGIDCPYISQIVEHVKEIVDVGGTEKHTGIILTNLIEEHLLEVGRKGQIFEWDFKQNERLLTESWLKFTIEIMQDHNIHIRSNHQELRTWREHDGYIMDIAFQMTAGAGGYSPDQIVSINTCRKYMNVVNISDISDGSGTNILSDVRKCIKIPSTSRNAYKWPRQLQPTRHDIDVWNDFITNITTRGSKLKVKLGKWKKQAEKWHQWKYNPQYDRVYQKTNTGWLVWIPSNTSRRTRRHRYLRTTTIAETEEIEGSNIAIISGYNRDSPIILLRGHSPLEDSEPQVTRTLKSEILNNGWAVRTVTIHDEEKIVNQIRAGHAKGGTDGSYDDGKSSSAFNIFEGDTDLLEGANYVPGPSKDQTSYRAELGGILGLIIVVNTICMRNGIQDGLFTLGCDNDSALRVAFDTGEVLCTSSCFDIIRMIRHQIKISPIRWNTQQVKGHQDKHKKYGELDDWGKSNVRADKAASDMMESHPTHINSADPAGAGWTLELNGVRVVANTSREIYNHVTSPAIKRHWADKHNINYEEFDDDTLEAAIYWDGISKMSKMIPHHQRRWITKHMAHISPTNFVMGPARRKERDTDVCPMCDEVEDTQHVFTCRSDLSTRTFEEAYDTLRTWILKHSQRDLGEAILEIILSIRERRESIVNETWSDEVKEAFYAQCNMSRTALVSGLLHTDWIEIQTKHLKRNRAKMKPDNWAGHVARLTWDVTWKIWRARTEYLHSTEEARKKILAANIDDDIDALFHNLPANTWMTKAQRSLLTIPKRRVKAYKTRRKIRWLRKAQTARKAYEKFLDNTQGSASAQLMRTYVGYGNNNNGNIQNQQINQEEKEYEEENVPRRQRQLNLDEWIQQPIDNG